MTNSENQTVHYWLLAKAWRAMKDSENQTMTKSNLTVWTVYKLVTWVSSDQIKSDCVDTEYVTWDMRIHFIFDIDDTMYQKKHFENWTIQLWPCTQTCRPMRYSVNWTIELLQCTQLYKCILLKRLYNSNSLNKVVDQWKTLKTKLYIPDCVHSLQACDLSQ